MSEQIKGATKFEQKVIDMLQNLGTTYPLVVGDPCKAEEWGIQHSKDCITIELRYAPTEKVLALNYRPHPEWSVIYREPSCSARLREFVMGRTF